MSEKDSVTISTESGDHEKMSIFVTIRVRPLNEREESENEISCLSIDPTNPNTITLATSSISSDTKPFCFDYVANQFASQKEVFQKVALPAADSCLEGYNGCIFAYGQTGAGKTYTITGSSNVETVLGCETRGMLPRVLEYLFNKIESQKSLYVEYLMKCSYLEIYNEHIIDLFAETGSSLQLREDIKKGVYVEGLTEMVTSTFFQAIEILKNGGKNRHNGATQLNRESSRSHSVFSITLQSKSLSDGITHLRYSRFHFVDLAGSERTKQTNAIGERLKEGCNINKSLSILGNVINSLVEVDNGRARYIHYRDSKLTFLLKDSLGGNSKTRLIANISPASIAFQETLSTLKFARRAKLIKNKVQINEDHTGNIEALNNEIKRLRIENMKLLNRRSQGSIFASSLPPSPTNAHSRETVETRARRLREESQKRQESEELCLHYLEQAQDLKSKIGFSLGKTREQLLELVRCGQELQKSEMQYRTIISFQRRRIELLDLQLNKKNPTNGDLNSFLNEERQAQKQEIARLSELLERQKYYSQMISEKTSDSEQLIGPNNIIKQQLEDNLSMLASLLDKIEDDIQQRVKIHSTLQDIESTKIIKQSPERQRKFENQLFQINKEYKDNLESLSKEVLKWKEKGGEDQRQLGIALEENKSLSRDLQKSRNMMEFKQAQHEQIVHDLKKLITGQPNDQQGNDKNTNNINSNSQIIQLELQSKIREIKEMEIQLNDFKKEQERISLENTAEKAKIIKKIEEEQEKMKKQIEDIKMELGNKEIEIIKQREQIEELKIKGDNFEEQYEIEKAESAQKDKVIQEKGQKLENIEEKTNYLQLKEKSMQEEIDILNETLNFREKEVEELRKEKAQMAIKVKRGEEQAKNLEKEHLEGIELIIQLTEQIKLNECKSKEQQQIVSNCQEQLKSRDTSISQMQSLLSLKDNSIKSKEQILSEQSLILKQQEQELFRLKTIDTDYIKLQKSNTSQQSINNELQEKCNKFQQELLHLQPQLNNLQSQKQIEDKQTTQLKQEVNQLKILKNQLEKEQQKANQTLEALKETNEKVMKENGILKNEVEENKYRISQLEELNCCAEKEINSLKTNLSKISSQAHEVKSLYAQMHAQLSQLEQKNTELKNTTSKLDLDSSSQKRDHLKEIEEKDKALREINSIQIGLLKRVEEQQKEYNNLTQQISQKQKEYDAQTVRAKEQEYEVKKSMKSERVKLENENMELFNKIKQLEDQLLQIKKDQSNTIVTNNQTQKSLEEKEKLQNELIQELQDKQLISEQNLICQKKEIGKYQQEISQLASSLQDHQNQVSQLKQDTTEKELLLQQQQQKIQHLELQFNNQKQENLEQIHLGNLLESNQEQMLLKEKEDKPHQNIRQPDENQKDILIKKLKDQLLSFQQNQEKQFSQKQQKSELGVNEDHNDSKKLSCIGMELTIQQEENLGLNKQINVTDKDNNHHTSLQQNNNQCNKAKNQNLSYPLQEQEASTSMRHQQQEQQQEQKQQQLIQQKESKQLLQQKHKGQEQQCEEEKIPENNIQQAKEGISQKQQQQCQVDDNQPTNSSGLSNNNLLNIQSIREIPNNFEQQNTLKIKGDSESWQDEKQSLLEQVSLLQIINEKLQLQLDNINTAHQSSFQHNQSATNQDKSPKVLEQQEEVSQLKNETDSHQICQQQLKSKLVNTEVEVEEKIKGCQQNKREIKQKNLKQFILNPSRQQQEQNITESIDFESDNLEEQGDDVNKQRRQIDECNKQIKSLQKQAEVYQKQIDKLTLDLNSYQLQIELEQQQFNDKQSSEAIRYQKELEENYVKINNCNQLLDQYQQKLQLSEQEQEKRTQELSQFQSILEQCKLEVKQYQLDSEINKQDILKYQQESQTMKEKSNISTQQLENQEESYKQKLQEQDTLITMIKQQSKSQVDQLTKELDVLKHEYESANIKLNQSVQQLEDKCNNLQSANLEQQGEYQNQMQALITSQQRELTDSKEQIIENQKTINGLNQKLIHQNEIEAQLKAKSSQLGLQVEELSQKMKNSQLKQAEQDQLISNQRQQINQLIQEKNEFEKNQEQDRLSNENLILKIQQIEAQRQELIRKDVEHNHNYQQLLENYKHYEANNQQLQLQNENLLIQKETLQKENSKINTISQQTSFQIKQIEDQNFRLNQQLESLNKEQQDLLIYTDKMKENSNRQNQQLEFLHKEKKELLSYTDQLKESYNQEKQQLLLQLDQMKHTIDQESQKLEQSKQQQEDIRSKCNQMMQQIQNENKKIVNDITIQNQSNIQVLQEQYHSELNALNHQRDAACKKVESTMKIVQDKELSRAKLAAELNQSKEFISTLTQEFNKVVGQNEILKNQLSELNIEVERIKQSEGSIQQQLKKEYNNLKVDSEQSQRHLENQINLLHEKSKEEKESFRQLTMNLQNMNEFLQKETNDKEELNSQLIIKLKEFQVELNDKDSYFTEQVKQLESDLKLKNEEYAKCKANLTQTTYEYQEGQKILEQKNFEIEGYKRELRQFYEKTQQFAQSRDKDLHEVKDQYSKLVEEHDKIMSLYNEKAQREVNYQRQLNQLSQDNVILNQDVKRIYANEKKLKAKLAEVVGVSKILNEEKNALQADIDSLHQDLTQIKRNEYQEDRKNHMKQVDINQPYSNEINADSSKEYYQNSKVSPFKQQMACDISLALPNILQEVAEKEMKLKELAKEHSQVEKAYQQLHSQQQSNNNIKDGNFQSFQKILNTNSNNNASANTYLPIKKQSLNSLINPSNYQTQQNQHSQSPHAFPNELKLVQLCERSNAQERSEEDKTENNIQKQQRNQMQANGFKNYYNSTNTRNSNNNNKCNSLNNIYYNSNQNNNICRNSPKNNNENQQQLQGKPTSQDKYPQGNQFNLNQQFLQPNDHQVSPFKPPSLRDENKNK